MNPGNGSGVSVYPGPWRQHWSVLIKTFTRDLVIVSTTWGVALYAEWPWLSMIAPLGLIPSLLAYVRWQRRCLFLTVTDIIIEFGVMTTQTADFPMWEIDMLEVSQTLLGKIFDYGDIAVFSGPSTLTFGKLHPISQFMATYQVYRHLSARGAVSSGRLLPQPSHSQLPEPRRYEPWREGDLMIEGRFRRLEHRVHDAAGRSIDWSSLFRLLALVLFISTIIAFIIGC